MTARTIRIHSRACCRIKAGDHDAGHRPQTADQQGHQESAKGQFFAHRTENHDHDAEQ